MNTFILNLAIHSFWFLVKDNRFKVQTIRSSEFAEKIEGYSTHPKSILIANELKKDDFIISIKNY